MCITFLKISPNFRIRFLLGFNREVEISKPTAPLAEWSEDPNILGGRDLVQGGSCLALNKLTGNIAILTNYSEGSSPKVLGKLSRGDIVRKFVSSSFFQDKGWKKQDAPQRYCQEILSEREQYLPFNLIVGNLFHLDAGFYSLDFEMPEPRRVPEDVFIGMSNSTFSSPYLKTRKGEDYLNSTSSKSDNESDSALQALEAVLSDTTYYKYHEGYDPEDAIFVRPFKVPKATIVVGTISSTIISLDQEGKLQITEKFNQLTGLPEIRLRTEANTSHPTSSLVRRKKLRRAVDRIRLLSRYSKSGVFPTKTITSNITVHL